MSTRSRIGMVNEDNTITSIYCHFDGYPEGVGNILMKYYNDESKIKELMDLGDISSLGMHIGVKHDFDDFGWFGDNNQCKAYGRDRGEENVEAIVSKSMDELCDLGSDYGVDYIYIWKDGRWLYTSDLDNNFKPLEEDI